ncbi:MAG TPA: HAD family hydrolase [Chloroflexota bacterium]|nr:HAD family hydrolase [Chloroflexota bacterium]
MASPPRAVTFDLWQTLMHDSKDQAAKRGRMRAERIHQVLARAGHAATVEQVEALVKDIWNEWQATYWDKLVDPGFDAQMAWLQERLRVPGGDGRLSEDLRHAYVDPIFAVAPVVDAEAIPVLTQLQARGLPLGLICNTSVTPGFALRRLLAQWGLDRLLRVQLFSDEMGVRKPAPEIFQEAARQLGVQPVDMLHVGDSVENDVEGAQAAGARALLVGPEAPLSRVFSTLQTN